MITGYGVAGDWASLPAHGLNMDALAGTVPLHWSEAGPEVPAGYRSVGTTVAGIEAVGAIYAALQPVKSAAELINDPHLLARERVISVEDSQLGTVRMQGVVPKLSRTPGEVRHAGQALGASNARVHGELLGMSEADIERARAQGII